MDIQNRPGKIHQNADALSRIDSSNIIRKIDMKENNWFNKVRIAQQLDPKIKRIFQQFEGNKNNENINELNNFIIKNDMLYYQKPTIRMINRGIHKIRLVIPESFKSLILEENHNSILGAHLGTKKTYQRIAENYYWEGMYKNAQEWTSMCIDCAMKKLGPDQQCGDSFSIVVSRPLEVIRADILGPLPMSTAGN